MSGLCEGWLGLDDWVAPPSRLGARGMLSSCCCGLAMLRLSARVGLRRRMASGCPSERSLTDVGFEHGAVCAQNRLRERLDNCIHSRRVTHTHTPHCYHETLPFLRIAFAIKTHVRLFYKFGRVPSRTHALSPSAAQTHTPPPADTSPPPASRRRLSARAFVQPS